ncbi:MAG: Hpt domain-containing protein [Roseovarius sp.]
MRGSETMIDRDRLAELHEEIGEEDFLEVATLFIEETDAAVAALAEIPPEGLAAHLHALKGSALNLGFTTFARICAHAEEAAAGGSGAAVDRAAITESYAASKAEFLAMLAGG